MAAGDVVILGRSNRSIRGLRLVFGTVQLDGGNPTPINLAGELSQVLGGMASLSGTGTPGTTAGGIAGLFVCEASGTTLNVRAFSGATPTAITNNTDVVAFMAWGRP